jgi:Na+:H+ antiporter, NhaA family
MSWRPTLRQERSAPAPGLTSRPLLEFLRAETTGGIALLAATVAALVWANTAGASYDTVWSSSMDLEVFGIHLPHDPRHWINDGLMTLFFFIVGVEIKRELVLGELNTTRKAMLPAFGAMGGMVLPALIYLVLNARTAPEGWGIPMATDIAFAVGLLTIMGSRVPSGLKVFVLSLAIVDDIGAIVVIALFYSGGLEWGWLAAAGAALLVVWVVGRFGFTSVVVYVCLGMFVWLATLASGVHATIAGVALGLLVSARPGDPSDQETSVAQRIDHHVHPWTSLLVVPLFALANAGLRFSELGDPGSAVTVGIVLGLVFGKTLGIAAFTWVAVTVRAGVLPEGVGWRHILGGAAVAGIGFTVSLFITSLAFDDEALISQAKLGVFAGSLMAGSLGAAFLASTHKRATTR